MRRDEIRALMNAILTRQGKPEATDDCALLRNVGFRSLDFSELALRVEKAMGRELNFNAAAMRGIQTVGDVLDFFQGAASDA